eukprot:365077-Chlamydomonas_euryale.AAC.9
MASRQGAATSQTGFGKPDHTPPHDPPSCHPRSLPPPLTSSPGAWKTPLSSTHLQRNPHGGIAARHSPVLRVLVGSHQANQGGTISTGRAKQADQLSRTPRAFLQRLHGWKTRHPSQKHTRAATVPLTRGSRNVVADP